MREADVDDGRRDGLTTDEKAELAHLRGERVLREVTFGVSVGPGKGQYGPMWTIFHWKVS